ncbi:alpha/beta fold hydrolase [Sulfurospirillum sp. 1307]|jgi:pimeloyl-ACP methyl ester carboxylesterase
MASREIIYNSKEYSLSYEILNPKNTKSILFLHGWGSNKEIMKQAFKSTLAGYKHIYLDMPGFGNSDIQEVICTQDYANIVRLFLKSLHVEVDCVVGHSFGGKVAALLNPKTLVLLSSAGIVRKKSFKVRVKIKCFKIFKHIVPKGFYKYFASEDVSGMSQIMYEILKNVVDEDFREIFRKINSKCFIFWGKEDMATPLKSGQMIANLIDNSKFFPLQGDHFFFLNQSNFIAKSIDGNI